MTYCLNPACQKPHNPAQTKFCLTCGEQLRLKNRYQAIKPISAGNFGRTFLAEDGDRLNSLCVIKQFMPSGVISGNSQAMTQAIQLFEREAQQLLKLGEHPQIPTLFAYLQENQRLYLVQEFIDGQDLGQDLAKNRKNLQRYTEGEIRQLLSDLLPVLQFIHDAGVIHRDIKPTNILRRRSHSTPYVKPGELVLIDFGVCKQLNNANLSKTGSLVGTEGYAPMEQLRSGKAYPASDLYSLGVTCIQLLAQKALNELYDPLEGRWVWRELLKRAGGDVSPQLSQVLDKMLKDGVNERYQSASEILKDLDSVAIAPSRQLVRAGIFSNAQTSTKPAPTAPLYSIALPPQTQTWRCSQTLVGHLGEVNSVAISPGSYILASGSWDNTIKVWQLGSGKLIHTLRGHFGYVSSVAISPDGYILASGSWDKTIKVWNLGSGKLIHTLRGHSGYVNAIAIGSDGEMLASCSRDKTIKIWHLDSGNLIVTLDAPDYIRSVALSPTGKTIAGGSDDRTVKVWQLDNNERSRPCPLHTFTGHSHCVRSVALSSDGRLLASGSWDNTVKLWQLDDEGRSLSSSPHTLAGHSCYVYSVAISPDGRLLASGSRDNTVKLWQLDANGDRQPSSIQTLTGHSGPVYSVAFSPDGLTLASGSDDTTIKIWRCES